MFNLLGQATSIITRLETIQGLNQIEYIDALSDLENKPRILPSASLLLRIGGSKNPENMTFDAGNSWVVVIVAKNMLGPQGHLAIIDDVCDALSGFQPEGVVRPLLPETWGFLERVGEAACATHVTFTVGQRATIKWDVRKN